MKTKWGNAKISNKGYYVITSRKEGNMHKFLHRLIWEDFYRCEVPKGYVIHHRNFNKLDNCILNLQLMRDKDHCILHNTGENNPWYGKHHSEETKKKISESSKSRYISEESIMKSSKARNNSGYFRVCKHKCNKVTQGFFWQYSYYENGKQKTISSVDIEKLESRVKSKGLKWIKFE